MMTDRDCFEAVLRGEMPDRIPWTPRLDIWYNYKMSTGTMPAPYNKMSLDELGIYLGAGYSARKGKIFDIEYSNSKQYTVINNDGYTNVIENCKGILTEKYIILLDDNGVAIKPSKVKYFLNGKDDYDVMIEHIRNIRFLPNYPEYIEYDRKIGDKALPLCIIGDVPAQAVLRLFAGYNEGFFHMIDFPEKFDDLINVYEKALKRMQEIVLSSPAKLFLHGMHFDSQLTTLKFYRKYILPYYKKLMPEIKNAGKYIAIHQDADASNLLEVIKESEINVADCLCTQPMVKLSLDKVFDVWQDKIVIWGGIPSIILNPESCSEDEFFTYANLAVQLAKTGKMILSVSDNVMPEADIERVRSISNMIR